MRRGQRCRWSVSDGRRRALAAISSGWRPRGCLRLLQVRRAAERTQRLMLAAVRLLAVEQPEQARAAVFRPGWDRGVAVGEDDRPIVVGVRVEELDHGGEGRAATALDFDTAPRPPEGHRLALELGVELDDVDGLDAVLEEPVDRREAPRQVRTAHRAADIHGDQQARGEVVSAAHVLEAVTAGWPPSPRPPPAP